MSSSSSPETSGVRCEPTVFVKNTFQTISRRNSAKYSHPHLALLNSTRYPEEKAILCQGLSTLDTIGAEAAAG